MKIVLYILITVILVSCNAHLTDDKKVILQKELEEMAKVDQIAATHWEESWVHFKDSVFTGHKFRVEKIFNSYGFPGFKQIGEKGSKNFWLIVQHCDKFPEFQKKVLTAMDKEVKKHNADPANFAYLFDRVQINSGQKQRFGTQVQYDETGRAVPRHGLIYSINIDKLRKEYNLPSLKEYLNQITIDHFEMNRESFLKEGITKPNLY